MDKYTQAELEKVERKDPVPRFQAKYKLATVSQFLTST
jgi:hypothetical protein